MDVEGSDYSKSELDSLQMLEDELRLDHHPPSVPDVTITTEQLSKRVAALELELERTRLELSAKNAANQGLKSIITELHVDARISIQEKQQLHNCVKDVECKLAATENSMNWYRRQVHEVQANKKTLQIEIDTYRDMLSQKSSTLMNVSSKYKQLNDDYMAIVQKHKREKDSLQAEIDLLKTSQKSITSVTKYDQQLPSTVPLLVHVGLSNRLELAEEELQKSRSELRSMEHRLQTLGSERAASKATCSNQQIQLSVAEDNLRSYEKERSSLAETCRELRVELGKLRSENASLQIGLLSARQDREQVEQAIEQLRLQLTKIITQYKLLRNKNGELEEKLSSMQNVCEENKRLKLLSYSTNASLFKRLRQERKKTNNLQKQLSQEQSKHRILSENL
ncbi:MAR-binding filament-like protein 1-1 [Copidosoma floridanum]|uniref:MAR-binding filament-like protein 1-1 n=1 Tax=Copidosoma floridanum TaxID=29053 RepID=UPI000C6F4979|nr:MAR-binding filament-like protein 1-1 [Copidosoma floridanum]